MYSPKHALKSVNGLSAVGIAALLVSVALCSPVSASADAGIDNASYQKCYDAQAARASGAAFSFTKITEGPGYANPYAQCQLDANLVAGLRRGVYDFARPDKYSAVIAAHNFNDVAAGMGLIHNGVIPVLDWEPRGHLGDVQWAKQWLDEVSAVWGVKPLIYMSASTISAADWSSVASADYGLWVAGYPKGYAPESLRYPGAPPYRVAPWPFAAAWQYSSSGNVPGVGRSVDVNWFYGDAVTWSKYAGAAVGSPANQAIGSTNAGNGAPVADDNTLASAVIRGEYGNDPTRRRLLGDRYAGVMSVVNTRLRVSSRPVRVRRTHVVRGGETLSGIARRAGVRVRDIRGYSSGNPNLIRTGERLYW
jgi:lysozyme